MGRNNIIGFAIAGAVLAFSFYVFSNSASLSSEVSKLYGDVKTLREQSAQEAEITKSLAETQADYDALSAMYISNSAEFIDLIETLEELAASNDLGAEVQIGPEPESGAGGIFSREITMTLFGSARSISSFISDLETYNALTAVKVLSIDGEEIVEDARARITFSVAWSNLGGRQ